MSKKEKKDIFWIAVFGLMIITYIVLLIKDRSINRSDVTFCGLLAAGILARAVHFIKIRKINNLVFDKEEEIDADLAEDEDPYITSSKPDEPDV